MSQDLRDYPTIRFHKKFGSANEMDITATFQGFYGSGVQFTIHGKGVEYVILAENQIRDLIKVLQKRLDKERGYGATDSEGTRKRVYPRKLRADSKQESLLPKNEGGKVD